MDLDEHDFICGITRTGYNILIVLPRYINRSRTTKRHGSNRKLIWGRIISFWTEEEHYINS